ncbi:MAG: FAD binding domain-containing protein, partial [Desulfobulbaceae bacterium]|nr:FAD binding domain-containing protein [Desulfobulbaceae bacterium]
VGNVAGKHIVTVEGLNGCGLTPVQQAFVDENGSQCGFCSPGLVMAVFGFILSDQPLTYEHGINMVAGNLCRCTGYKSIARTMRQVVALLEPLGQLKGEEKLNWLIANHFLPDTFNNIAARLAQLSTPSATITPGGMIIAGGTDAMVQNLTTVESASSLTLISELPELQGIQLNGDQCTIGAATTFAELGGHEELANRLPCLNKGLRLIASAHIRNMATIGGNLANGSPIGDLSILFTAMEATLCLRRNGVSRELPLREFFVGYKKVNKAEDELIEAVRINLPDGQTMVSFEKTGKRIHLDMATVNSALKLTLEHGKITHAAYAVGGLGPTIRTMDETTDFLLGKQINNDTFREANKVAQSEITPRSRAEYKRLLVRQQLFAHFLAFGPEVMTLEALR